MDRPRFQVDIGTMMVAVILAALCIASAIYLGPESPLPIIAVGAHFIASNHVNGRVRAEKRTITEADRWITAKVGIAAGLTVALLYCVGLTVWRNAPR